MSVVGVWAADSSNGNVVHVIKPEDRHRHADMLGRVLVPDASESLGTEDGYDGASPFVGPETCAQCHREKYDGFIKTTHYQASRSGSAETILGSAEPPSNYLETIEPRLHHPSAIERKCTGHAW